MSFSSLYNRIRGAILGFMIGRDAIEKCALTGLQTQQMFERYGKGEIERRSQRHELISVIYCDVQHFKAVNDQLSHGIGNLLLAKVGNRTAQFFRHDDPIRAGGDEIIILMLGATYEVAEDKARLLQKLIWVILQSAEFRREVANTLGREGRPDRISNIKETLDNVGLNVGVATGQSGDDIDTLVARAEARMETDKAINKAYKPWVNWGRRQ